MSAIRRARLLLLQVWENMLLAFETLRHRLMRSFLTVLGVFIGVVIIVGVASVLNGFNEGVVQDFKKWGAETIYVMRFPAMQMMKPTAEMRKRKDFIEEDVVALDKECNALDGVCPFLVYRRFDLKVVSGANEMEGPIIRGTWPIIQNVLTIDMEDGRFFTEEENRHRVPVCVIGQNILKALFPTRSAVGKSITLEGQRLRVIGTMGEFPRSLSFGEENPEDSLIFVPLNVFRQMFPDEKEMVIIALAQRGQQDRAIDQVEEVLRRRRHVAWTAPNDFDVQTPDSYIEIFNEIMGATVAVMFALSAVAFIVGGVGVMNVMLASVKERTREIGIRRAIGARRRDIIWQFLIEAMTLTVLGGVLGVVAGEGIMRLIVMFVPSLPCATPMWARMFGFFGSMSVGLIFGLWPAITAARLDPIDALRYE